MKTSINLSDQLKTMGIKALLYPISFVGQWTWILTIFFCFNYLVAVEATAQQQSYLYYPFGFQGMERNDDERGSGNEYTTYYRVLDSRAGKWISTDPALSPSVSPYQALGNNPIRMVDPDGDTIRFSSESRAHAMGDINTIIADLQFFTGLQLYLGRNGNLLYRTDDQGRPIISRDASGREIGGTYSRDQLMRLIRHATVADVEIVPSNPRMEGGDLGSISREGSIRLSQNDVTNNLRALQADGTIDPRSMGWGITLFHEAYHGVYGWTDENLMVGLENHFRREADYQMERGSSSLRFRRRLRYGEGDERSVAEYFYPRTAPPPRRSWGCGCSAVGM